MPRSKVPFVLLLFVLSITGCSNPSTSPNGGGWVQTGLHRGGKIQALAVIRQNAASQTLFAGTETSGIFTSVDDGITWKASNAGLGSNNILALAVDSMNASSPILYAGTFDAGVFRSTDNGVNWTSINRGLTGLRIHALAVSNGNLFASADNPSYIRGGIFISHDHGSNWNAVNTGASGVFVQCFVTTDTNVFIGTLSGIYRISNSGANWIEVDSGLASTTSLSESAVYTMAVRAAPTPTLYAGTDAGRVLFSSNAGASWNGLSNGLGGWPVSALLVGVDGIPQTDLIAGTIGKGIYLSTNSGSNWTSVNTGLTNLFVTILAVEDGYLFAGTDTDGLWRRPIVEITSH